MTRTSYRVPAMIAPFDATVHVPGSKSHANRLIVCACLTEGETRITGATPCDDVAVMVANLQTMGFDLQWIDHQRGILSVRGGVPSRALGEPCVLDCHNAGTTLRFLASVAAFVPGRWILTGDAHMQRRPIGDLVAALQALGVDARATNDCPPVHIVGGTMRGGTVTLDARISSQFLTSLLLVGPRVPTGLRVALSGPLASSGYVELTARVMRDFGIDVQRERDCFVVSNQQYRSRGSYTVEGDWSAAGAWCVLETCTGSVIRMPALTTDSVQADRHLPLALARLASPGDCTLDATEIPDQVMNLAVRAAVRRGTTTMRGLTNLRRKECDRLAVIAQALATAGVDIEELPDGLIIRGAGSLAALATQKHPVTLDPHGDHRMAMAYAILGLLRGNVTVADPACVQKSYPTFFADLTSLLSETKPIVIVGMRGVGKSSMGRRLARRLRLRHDDADWLVEKRCGMTVAAYVAAHGWEAFRREEEAVIADALRPGCVLSLGGGALESAATLARVSMHAIVVWLQADEAEIVRRLKRRARPALSALPLEEEVRTVLQQRTPQYERAAHIRVPPSLPFGAQVPFVVRSLRRHLLETDR